MATGKDPANKSTTNHRGEEEQAPQTTMGAHECLLGARDWPFLNPHHSKSTRTKDCWSALELQDRHYSVMIILHKKTIRKQDCGFSNKEPSEHCPQCSNKLEERPHCTNHDCYLVLVALLRSGHYGGRECSRQEWFPFHIMNARTPPQ